MKKFLPHQALLTFRKSENKKKIGIAQKLAAKWFSFAYESSILFENNFEELISISNGKFFEKQIYILLSFQNFRKSSSYSTRILNKFRLKIKRIISYVFFISSNRERNLNNSFLFLIRT